MADEPTEQAGREALAEVLIEARDAHSYPVDGDDGWESRCRCGMWPPLSTVTSELNEHLWLWRHQHDEVAKAVLAAGYAPPTAHAAVVTDRDALQRRLDGSRARVEIMTALHEDARVALAAFADRMDEHAYQELASPLDDGVLDEYGDLYVSERDRLKADRDALQRRLDEAEAKIERVQKVLDDANSVSIWSSSVQDALDGPA